MTEYCSCCGLDLDLFEDDETKHPTKEDIKFVNNFILESRIPFGNVSVFWGEYMVSWHNQDETKNLNLIKYPKVDLKLYSGNYGDSSIPFESRKSECYTVYSQNDFLEKYQWMMN